MKTRVAIYGFGRLGRAVYAVASKRRDMEVVMVATSRSPQYVAEALMTDLVYDALMANIAAVPGGFTHDERHVHLRSVKTASLWEGHDIDVVLDTMTAQPTDVTAEKHLAAGAKKVVFAQPARDVTTVVYGVNDQDALAPKTVAVSGGGAENAAAAPVLEIVRDICGVESYLTTTVDGALCSCQNGECNADHAAAVPVQPAVHLQAPKLLVSMTELVVHTKKAVTEETLNSGLHEKSADPYYQGIVAFRSEPVSPDDIIGESVSACVDGARTVLGGTRLLSLKLWYDREWSYANRLVELTADFAKLKAKE